MNKIHGALALTLACAGVFFGAQSTYAVTSTLPEPVEGVITLNDDVELAASYVVANGENITIDLAGHTISGTTGLKSDLLTVNLGGSLTVKDSVGNGLVDSSNLYDNYATIYNNGTTIIDGGEFKLDVSVNNNTYYLILNHGTMTINGGSFVSNDNDNETTLDKVEGSSLLANGYYSYTSSNPRSGYVAGTNQEYPTLTIKGGTFDGGLNTIKVDDGGDVTIDGGTFSNTSQVSLFIWGTATINGGTFNTPTGKDKTNIFVGSAGADSIDPGKLVINGGTFNAEYLLETYNAQGNSIATPVEITGGTFNYTKSLWNDSGASGSIMQDGTPVATNGAGITGTVFAPISALAVAKAGSTVYLTDYKVGDTLNIPADVDVKFANTSTEADDTDEYDYELVQNEDGTYTVIKTLKPVTDEETEDSTEVSPPTGDLNPVAIAIVMMVAALTFGLVYRSERATRR